MRLLNRTTRSVGLTAVGERLLSRLRPVLDDYEGALESINDFRDRPCGLLRLTVLPPASEFILAPVLGRFLAQYCDIKLEILAEPALQDIVAERFDADGRLAGNVVAGVERNDLFLEELRHFLACLRGEARPLVSVQEGVQSLKIAMAAHQSLENWTVEHLA